MAATAPSIAIVDDSLIIRTIARKVIHQLHYNIIIEADNGLDLFKQLRNICTPPDICLLDLEMPGMDGFDTAIALSQEYPLIRILAYSSSTSPDYISRILACGAKDFLPKDSGLHKWRDALKRMAVDPVIR